MPHFVRKIIIIGVVVVVILILLAYFNDVDFKDLEEVFSCTFYIVVALIVTSLVSYSVLESYYSRKITKVIDKHNIVIVEEIVDEKNMNMLRDYGNIAENDKVISVLITDSKEEPYYVLEKTYFRT